MTDRKVTVTLRRADRGALGPALMDETARRAIAYLASSSDDRTAQHIKAVTGMHFVYEVLRGESSFGDLFVPDRTDRRRKPARRWRLDERVEHIDRDVLIGTDEPLVLCHACDRRMTEMLAARGDGTLVVLVREKGHP